MNDLNKKKKVELNNAVFWPAIILLAIFIGFGVFQQETLGKILNNMLYGMADSAGWFFELLAFFVLILTVVIAVTKYGNIRIGGPDAKPDYKRWNWITMSLCGGIGTGLLFWAMGEPIYHFTGPPAAAGAEALSREAAIFSVSQAMWQWSLPEYTMYTMCAVIFALAVFNYKKPLSFGPVLELSCGRKVKPLENIVHGLTIFTMCGAVACSMGVGLLQIGAGLHAITGIPQTKVLWLGIAVVITALFTISCVSGIGKGLKKMASFTTIVFIVILLYVMILGPTGFMAKLGVESFAEMITKWPQKTMLLNSLAPEDSWYADWTVQYWASFIVYAPILGLFLSRLAKGRTVREFILVNVLAPSAFCIVWIAVFGSMTIQLQSSGEFDVLAAVNENGMQSTIFHILDQFPLGKVLIVAFVVSIFTSFATMADPIAAALATISTKRSISIDEEAPSILKVVIGIIMGSIAYILVASGGVTSVKGMWVIIGLPIAFLLILMMVGVFRSANALLKRSDHLGNYDEVVKK